MSGKKLRSNKTQIRVLIDYMSTNPHAATGEFTGPMGNRRAEAQWLKIKELLKNYGPDRTVEQWKQTWKDLKKNARSENALNAQASTSTGNHVFVPDVSTNTKKILDTIGHESSIGIGPEESAIGPIVNIALLLAERNELLRQQNEIMKAANNIARRNSQSRRSSF